MTGFAGEDRLGIIVSLVVHACAILLLVVASLAVGNRPVKTVEVDFSIVRDHSKGGSAEDFGRASPGKRPRGSGGGSSSPKAPGSALFMGEHREVLAGRVRMDPPPQTAMVSASDPRADTVIQGVEAGHADSSGQVGSLQAHGAGGSGARSGTGGSGEGRGGDWGEGRGGDRGAGEGLAEGGRDYGYIRDAVTKNIRYPDEAIRLGIEGRVIVSFVVLENGTTSRIRVVTGSGYRILDESAREAVALTRIHRKVPYRVIVHLPITYKLQG